MIDGAGGPEHADPDPSWCAPTGGATWPSEPITDALGCHLARPAHWDDEPVDETVGPVSTRSWRGPLPEECLQVAHLGAADEAADPRGWVTAGLALLGVPDLPALQPIAEQAELLAWHPTATLSGLAERLRADDAAGFEGLVRDDAPRLIRVYLVVVRRGGDAWKIGLTIASACLPGTPDDVVEANDHVRASVVFGALSLP